MPNNASAEKRQRQEQKRRLHNRMVKSIVKTNVTKARQALTTGIDSEEAVRAAVSELDIAAKKGVIHRNNAARRKSRLMKQLNAINSELDGHFDGALSALGTDVGRFWRGNS